MNEVQHTDRRGKDQEGLTEREGQTHEKGLKDMDTAIGVRKEGPNRTMIA